MARSYWFLRFRVAELTAIALTDTGVYAGRRSLCNNWGAGDHRRRASGCDGDRRARSQHDRSRFLHRSARNVPVSEADMATLKTDLIRAGFRSEKARGGVLRRPHPVHVAGHAGSSCGCMVRSMPANPVMRVVLLVWLRRGRMDSPRIFLERRSKRQETPAAFAARCAGSDGGLGGGRPRAGPGDSARGPGAGR